MNLAVISDEQLKEAFLSKKPAGDTVVCFVNTPGDVPEGSDVIFDLLFENTPGRISALKQFLPRPVFINAVTDTISSIGQPFIRINAWPAFLTRTITEVAAMPEQAATVKIIFEKLGWPYKIVPDITGMISPRMLAAIISEAYYTLHEKVSTKEEIDTAMKLGTNYPYGPFEWSKKIGLKNIYALLIQLSKENNLYEVSSLLTDENII